MSDSALSKENSGTPEPRSKVPSATQPNAPGLIFDDTHNGLNTDNQSHPGEPFWDTKQAWGWRQWMRISLGAGLLLFLVGLVVVAKTMVHAAGPQPPLLVTAPSSAPNMPSPLEPTAEGPPTIGAIHYLSDKDSTTVTVDLNRLVYFNAHRLSGPQRVYFDFPGTGMPGGLHGRPIEVSVAEPLVQKIRVAEWKPGTTRIVLETTQRCDYSAMIISAPYRLVVKLHPSE